MGWWLYRIYLLPDHHSGTSECSCPRPCPNRVESKAAYIPLLCYSCRLTFKELVRFWGAGGGVRGRGGSPGSQPLSCRVPLTRCPPTCAPRASAGSAGTGAGGPLPPLLLSPQGRVHPVSIPCSAEMEQNQESSKS